MPRVSVVMAVYNAGRFIREAVSSVLAQTYTNFELIAIDDASSDDSLVILESFDDARIRIIKHHENLGAALSRNDGFDAAQGEFIAIMDADDMCVPTRLERQVAYLDDHTAVGLVGCGIYDHVDVNGSVLRTSVLPWENEAIQSALLEQWCFLHSSIVFRKNLLTLTGGYRSIFEPVEDYDLVLRIVEHSHAYNIPEPLVSYRLNPEGLSATGQVYVGELNDTAIRMALRRRSGQAEEFEIEEPRLRDFKRKRNRTDAVFAISAAVGC